MSTPREPKGVGSTKKSQLQEYIHPSAYSQRHIVSLKGISQWSDSEREAHFKHNRILQEGFLTRDAKEVVNDAILCKEDWLTDIVCPSVQASLALHIATNLVVTYTVDEADLNAKTREIMNNLTQDATRIPELEAEIDKELNTEEKKSQIEQAALKRFTASAEKRFAEKYPKEDIKNPKNKEILEALKDINNPENTGTLAAFRRIQKDIEQKKITDEIVAAYVDKAMRENKDTFGLTEKQTKEKGQNTDNVYLGAAGSGKSTIMRQQMSDKNAKEHMVILATDSYRGVTVPGFEQRENATETDQIFIRTQDTAYMIKELVRGKLKTLEKRPDILVDGVTLEGWHRDLLLGNKKTISNIAALDDASLVAGRAYNRALDPNAGPADKGRQVHTTALFKGHGDASKFWLSGVPKGVDTEIYDTNVPRRGEKPKVIGRIHAKEGEESIDVLDLSKIAKFLGKANLNPEAADKAYLYSDPNKTYKQFTATDAHKAEEILKAVRSSGSPTDKFFKPSFTVMLLKPDGKPFATIREKSKGELELSVQDKDAYNDALKGPAKGILTEITQRVILKEKTLEEAHQRTLTFGTKKASQAIKKAIDTPPASPKPKP